MVGKNVSGAVQGCASGKLFGLVLQEAVMFNAAGEGAEVRKHMCTAE